MGIYCMHVHHMGHYMLLHVQCRNILKEDLQRTSHIETPHKHMETLTEDGTLRGYKHWYVIVSTENQGTPHAWRKVHVIIQRRHPMPDQHNFCHDHFKFF